MSSGFQKKADLRHISAPPKQFKAKSLFTGKPLPQLRQSVPKTCFQGSFDNSIASPDFLHSRKPVKRSLFQQRNSTEEAPVPHFSAWRKELNQVPRIRRPGVSLQAVSSVTYRGESVPAKEAMRDKDWAVRARNSISIELSRFINASNGVSVSFSEEAQGIYKFYLGRGNNSAVVKQCLNSRWWWTPVDSPMHANLVWTQLVNPAYMESVPCCSHTGEREREQNSGQTLECHVLFESLARVVRPVDISGLGYDLVTNSEHYTAFAESAVLMPRAIRLANRLEHNYILADKKCLYVHMKQFYSAHGRNVFDYMPVTFHVQNLEDPEYEVFASEFRRRQEENLNNTWILKPGENTNRGNGICLCDKLEDIETDLQNNPFPQTGQHTYIVQEYLVNPFLIHNRKFDIRCFVLVTSVNQVIQAYFYHEGYLRTASKEYTSADLNNKFVHLTNDAIQKKSPTYGKHEAGNKLSYRDFQRYLDNRRVETNFIQQILPQIKAIVADTIEATCGQLDQCQRLHSFEVFGYDFLLDHNLRPWLIEVNTNPCLDTSSSILARIIPAMLENAFKLAVDPLFPEPPVSPRRVPSSLFAETLHENRFELIFHRLLPMN